MKIAYLGPEGSFTQLATSHLFPKEELLPQAYILDCFKAVEDNLVEYAVVPLENSLEGTVSMTLDLLYDYESIHVLGEIILPISHHLMVHPDHDTFHKIYSHPQALAQTFNFRYKNYKDVPTHDFNSTAAAAKKIAQSPHENWAAIANKHAAKLYGLKILHENIQDSDQNHTRFIIISKKHESIDFSFVNPNPKSALFITLPIDHAGGLHQVLSVFAWRQMNLSKIESRTLKTGLGRYFFYLNIEGEWNNPLFTNSLDELEAIGAKVRFLGHYKEYLIQN